ADRGGRTHGRPGQLPFAGNPRSARIAVRRIAKDDSDGDPRPDSRRSRPSSAADRQGASRRGPRQPPEQEANGPRVPDLLTFIRLILKNLGRNKLRTALTALAVTIMVTICVAMKAVLGAVSKHVEAEGGQSRLVVSERWVIPSRIPIRYVRELTRL